MTNLDRTVQLLHERGDDLHAEPLRLGKVEVLGHPRALVAHGNRQIVLSNTGNSDLHLSTLLARVGVLRRVCDQLVDDKCGGDGRDRQKTRSRTEPRCE
jgi:hypothetical protein